MPLHASVLGTPAGSVRSTLDRRWTMAYAAGVPDETPELYDTTGDLVVHPLFPVAPEWQLVMAQRAEGSGLSPDEVRRGIHLHHDLLLHRPLRADESVEIVGRTVAVGERRAGATQTVLYTAVDSEGAVVWRTQNTSLFLGVPLVGDPAEEPVDWPADGHATESDDGGAAPDPVAVMESQVRAVDAHVYSECARIWNPIHTDTAAARAAGLAMPILHGTATLARAVSLATRTVDVPITAVRRVAGSFTNPVELGTTILVRVLTTGSRSLTFDVLTHTSTPAIRHGVIAW